MKKKSTSPTQRSLKYLRAAGFTAQVVEKWNQYAGVRIDLFGFGDILAFDPARQITALVQTTSGSNMAARKHKILGNTHAASWLAAGNKIILHGWCKRERKGMRDQKRVRYELREEEIKI